MQNSEPEESRSVGRDALSPHASSSLPFRILQFCTFHGFALLSLMVLNGVAGLNCLLPTSFPLCSLAKFRTIIAASLIRSLVLNGRGLPD